MNQNRTGSRITASLLARLIVLSLVLPLAMMPVAASDYTFGLFGSSN